MDKYIDYIVRNVTWKKGLLCSLIFAFFYWLINFSGIGIAGLLKITGGASILDLEFGYTYEEAQRILTELGIKGREFYLNKIVPVDFAFPFSYMLIYTVWMAMLLKYIKINNWYKYLIFFPIFAMLFDYIENIGIIIMLKTYPNLPKWAVFESSITGILKTIFVILNWLIIIVLFIIFITKAIKNQFKKSLKTNYQPSKRA